MPVTEPLRRARFNRKGNVQLGEVNLEQSDCCCDFCDRMQLLNVQIEKFLKIIFGTLLFGPFEEQNPRILLTFRSFLLVTYARRLVGQIAPAHKSH